jgi:putative phage-type endonuclease
MEATAMADDVRTAWLEQRRTGIGGSDAAAVMGLSRWRTPLSVWLDKTGHGEAVTESEPMRWGTLLEPVIRQEYASKTGMAVGLPGLLRHPDHEFIIGTPDGIADDGRVVEIKTARSGDGWGEPNSDQVPEDYLIQCQHYMMVSGAALADVAVLIGGSDFRVYTIAADTELHAMMIDAEVAFWRRVVDRDPPPAISYQDALAMYGRTSKAKLAVADEAVIDALSGLKAARRSRDELEAREEQLKATVMAAMGECDTLVDAGGTVLATWRASAAPKRLNAKALAAAHPDIHARFLEEGQPSRRFLLKGEK